MLQKTVGVALVAGLIGISLAMSSPEMFRVRCPKCLTEFVQSPPTITTNSVAGIMNGTNYVRELPLRCPKCKHEFTARNTKYVETPIAQSLPELPTPLPARMMAPIVPLTLERVNTIVGASYLLSAPEGYEVEIQSMGGMPVETLLGLHATNRPFSWVLTVKRK